MSEKKKTDLKPILLVVGVIALWITLSNQCNKSRSYDCIEKYTNKGYSYQQAKNKCQELEDAYDGDIR